VSGASPAWAAIVGAFEHPERKIPEGTTADVISQVAAGAMSDAGVGPSDIDGFFFAGMHQGLSPATMADHLGLDNLTHVDSTDVGGASTVSQIGHAAEAIAAGKCSIALIAMGGRPLAAAGGGPATAKDGPARYQSDLDLTQIAAYALVANRHMNEYGTTRRQLAMVKVSASLHAQHNPRARLPFAVTVDEVLESPLISDPLRRLDCCVTTDGGGAIVVVSRDVAAALGAERPAWVRGWAEGIRTTSGGRLDLMKVGADRTGPVAYEQAGITPKDIDYASIYDSFTITLLLALENLGLCEPGQAGRFIEDGGIVAPEGRLPVNTDGGGLSNNHPDRRGGMARTIEAVRQVRGRATPAVQVENCDHAIIHGIGHSLATNASAATVVLGREDR
jgi:acetyl-CoA C-acetyltransferase